MSIRTERVASLFQREIAGILGSEFSDQIHPMVTVTGARVSGDLGIAYIYVSVMGDSENLKQGALTKIKDLSPKIRKSLAKAVRHQVKSIPELRFFLDRTLETAHRMDELFVQINKERSGRDSNVAQDGVSEEDSPAPTS